MSTRSEGAARRDTGPLLAVDGLKKHFPIRKGLLSRTTGHVYAVDGVSFTIDRGESLGLVGESGCGKSTVGKTVLKLLTPTAGTIRLRGAEITTLRESEMRPYRREMQIIFQDPYSSLNPRMKAGDIVREPLVIHGVAKGGEREDRVAAVLRRVGLHPDSMGRYANEFSGGQRQRIGIARALVLNPSLIVCDEPVSALDVSIQAQVINLLIDLQEEFELTYLFIAHDLAVVKHVSHRIAVMYLGRIVELCRKEALFAEPLHPYTECLLSSVPIPNPNLERRERIVPVGEVPSPSDPPTGCHFHTRCPHALDVCRAEVPQLREKRPGHWAACHLR